MNSFSHCVEWRMACHGAKQDISVQIEKKMGGMETEEKKILPLLQKCKSFRDGDQRLTSPLLMLWQQFPDCFTFEIFTKHTDARSDRQNKVLRKTQSWIHVRLWWLVLIEQKKDYKRIKKDTLWPFPSTLIRQHSNMMVLTKIISQHQNPLLIRTACKWIVQRRKTNPAANWLSSPCFPCVNGNFHSPVKCLLIIPSDKKKFMCDDKIGIDSPPGAVEWFVYLSISDSLLFFPSCLSSSLHVSGSEFVKYR